MRSEADLPSALFSASRVCLRWLTEDPARPNKNSARDSSVRHEIDFVLTNKGIPFSRTVNQIISWNEGEYESKIINSQH